MMSCPIPREAPGRPGSGRPVRAPCGVCTTVTTVDLISRARAGDGAAFDELTQPYRREMQVHCYRMLGSLEDAEDALQDTLLAAWRGLGAFEGRSSLRTWLYQGGTPRGVDARARAARRHA